MGISHDRHVVMREGKVSEVMDLYRRLRVYILTPRLDENACVLVLESSHVTPS
jgi:hypothetical protein